MFFKPTPEDIETKLNDLESKIRNVDSPFYRPSKNDWDSIFETCKEISESFKEVSYPNKNSKNEAWTRFISRRNEAYNLRKSKTQNHSEKYYDEFMSRLQSADYDKLADFVVGKVLSFGAMKTTANDMRACGRSLRQIISDYHRVKYEMTKDHSARVQERIIEVKQHHNDFWGTYNSYQEEKSKAHSLKQKAWEEKKKEHERKQQEWEARKKEKEQKQKEWEARKIERDRKQKEWEARKAERERKQKEWEIRKAERERKQREWEMRKAERERKQREWEIRKAERERKQREWEIRKAEREQKQREWEAKKAEREREKERRQREWEERQRERERRQYEREQRNANRSSYKKNRKGGGCYITSAVCNTLGKPDDCEELTLIRAFRDNWLVYQKNGSIIIQSYYELAPLIVNEIDKKDNSEFIYQDIWINYLSLFYKQIKCKINEDALRTYLEMVSALKAKYLSI